MTETLTRAVPEHLLALNWFELEEARALAILSELESELKELKGKLTVKRVHACRVVIRRWYSIWEILEQDNWSDEIYLRKVARPLSRINKALGRLRDLDVNLGDAESYDCPPEILAKWRNKRAKLARKVTRKIKEQKPRKVAKQLAEHLSRRAYEIERLLLPLPGEEISMDGAEKPFTSPLEAASYHHIERFLKESEEEARSKARLADSAEGLHDLRLCVKRWRYLLTEFFGLTNIELVRAQQLLGKHHDLTRLTVKIRAACGKKDKAPAIGPCIGRIEDDLTAIEADLEQIKRSLPYGLRPYKLSTLIG